MEIKHFKLIFFFLIIICTIFAGCEYPIISHSFKELNEDSNLELEYSNILTVNAVHTYKNSYSNSYKPSDSTSYTIDEIGEASSRVKNYIESNHKLPNYVDIKSRHVTMPEYLFISTTAVKQIKIGSNTPVTLKSVNNPVNPSETVTTGNIYTDEYVDMAGRIINFINSNGMAPNYSSSSYGNVRYESLVYMYSRIMNYHHSNRVLPNYASINPWNENEMSQYLGPTANCQSNDQVIISFSSSLTCVEDSQYTKASKLFNWVRDHISYAYYYNTLHGALETKRIGSGNCCDQTHLLIALSRASGIPARYVHGDCYFTSSGKWYGHVWAEIYVNGQWYRADPISQRNSFGVINNWNVDTANVKGRYSELPF